MSTIETADRDWQPTGTSVAISSGITLLVVSVLAWQTDGIVVPIALGVLGAVTFAGSCWMLSFDGYRTVVVPAVSLLTLPTAIGLFGSTIVVVLSLSGELFPVEDGSLVSVGALIVVGHAGVVLGSTVAILGLMVGARNILGGHSLERYSRISVLTGTVPALGSVVLVLNGLIFEGTGPIGYSGAVARTVLTILVGPDPSGYHLSTFLLVVGLATGSTLVAMRTLPVRELVVDPGRNETDIVRLSRVISILRLAFVTSAALFAVTLGIEISVTTEELRSLVGSQLYDAAQVLTTQRVIRSVFVAVAVLALFSAVVSVVVRRIARKTLVNFVGLVGPLVGGLFITIVAVIVADPVYHTIAEAVVEPLPDTLGAEFYETSNAATEVFGEETFVVLLALGLILATSTFVLSLRLARRFGYLSPTASGYSLASGGLFVGTVFAATIGTPAWLVFGGVLSSLLVWDAGRFATTLGREIGHGADTRGVELAHVGSTLLVGIGGVLVAAAVSWIVEDSLVLSPVTPVALLLFATGLVFLVAALR